MNLQQLPASSGPYSIAYRHQKGVGPGIIFCSGFRSDMTSTKATAIAEWCRQNSAPFTRFDYFAHGATGGEFTEFTIGKAVSDTFDVLDQVTQGDQIIIGSSMGAWIALGAALERRSKIRGLIGIAPAPDFTERLMFAKMTPEQRKELEEEGQIWVPSEYSVTEYPITHHFIHEARQHLLLDDVIGLDMPIHLLHGQEDADVPWETSLQLADKIMSDDVTITLIKDGDHRLNRPADLALLTDAIARMRNRLTE
jgi:pimeloyl-ACP methyl ester carboxylesterase